MKKKIIGAVLGGTAVASLAFASASLLTVDGGIVQTGAAGSLSCDADGVKINWGLETTDNKVYHARISGIDEACEGATLVIRTNLSTIQEYVTIPQGGGEATIRFDVPQDAEALTSARVWIGK